MNRIDLTKPGGFPLTQNRLAFLQQTYEDGINAFGAAFGNIAGPYVVSGMAVSGGGNTVASGWFFYGGELIQFTGATVSPTGGQVALVTITATIGTLTYNNASTPAVISTYTATLTAATSVTDATHFPVSALVTFPVSLGLMGREVAESTVAVSTGIGHGSVTGTIYYRKNFINNTMQVRGSLVAATPADFNPFPSVPITLLGVFPAGYIPNNPVGFFCHGANATNIFLLDSTSADYIKPEMHIDAAGNIGAYLSDSFSHAPYTFSFNVIVPLD